MVFSSLVFLFIFLPLVLLVYYICPVKIRNYVLLIFSFIFYAWGEPKAFFIMLLVILINYVFALCIQKHEKYKTLFLPLVLLTSLFFLFFFKYFDFAIKIFNKFFSKNISSFNIALPIGISFYIFQSISYTIDVYKKECFAQKNITKLALYICFFPQLIAGPIVKYHEIEKQIDYRKTSFEDFTSGIKRFILGLAKKVLIANTCAVIVDTIFAEFLSCSQVLLWIGAISYSLQIYFDFSGYSDMALGLGQMFGFKFLENFNYPYIAHSVTDFWRRWHISLSTWFKEYVYIPLGGNKVCKLKNFFNVFIVFLLTGVWHGAAYTFIAWGIFHGFFNIIEKIFGFYRKAKNPILKILQHFYLLFVVLIGWVIFRSDGLHNAKDYIFMLLGLKETKNALPIELVLSPYTIFILLFSCAISTPVFPFLKEKINRTCIKNCTLNLIVTIIQDILFLCLLILCAANLASGTYNPFIYFRF